MRILISGASGFLGSALTPRLESNGHTVVRLVRRAATSATEITWDPARGALAPIAVEQFDAVIHLSGEGIADQRWSQDRKQRLLNSRVESTRLLAETLARLTARPKVLVSMSAVGWYGDRGDEQLTESSREGRGFLASLARAWEQAAEPARRAGIRVVHPRLGVVLAEHGGALARLLTPFRLGLGGPLGGGRAWWSWIALEDVLAGMEYVLAHDVLVGPVNFTAPNPVRNSELARALGRALGRPAFVPTPPFALRLLFGEMADDVLLASARALPARLLETGYAFRQPMLEPALRDALGRPAATAAA